MKREAVPLVAALLLLGNWSAGCTENTSGCSPTYAELGYPLEVEVGAWEITVRLVAIGCKEKLSPSWPPDRQQLEKALAADWSESHPVQLLYLMSERSSEIRKSVSTIVNKVVGDAIVDDVLLLDAKAAESL